MNSRRVILTLTVLCLFALLFWWSVKKRAAPVPHRGHSSPTPTTTSAPTPPRRSPTPLRQRLAGVAQGKAGYAAIEGPDGVSHLYRVGEEIPGLGRLVRIDSNSATVESPSGLIRLRVAPAPTPSITPSQRPLPTRSPARLTPTARPLQPDRTASGSSP